MQFWICVWVVVCCCSMSSISWICLRSHVFKHCSDWIAVRYSAVIGFEDKTRQDKTRQDRTRQDKAVYHKAGIHEQIHSSNYLLRQRAKLTCLHIETQYPCSTFCTCDTQKVSEHYSFCTYGCCIGYAVPPAPDPQFLQHMAASLLGLNVKPVVRGGTWAESRIAVQSNGGAPGPSWIRWYLQDQAEHAAWTLQLLQLFPVSHNFAWNLGNTFSDLLIIIYNDFKYLLHPFTILPTHLAVLVRWAGYPMPALPPPVATSPAQSAAGSGLNLAKDVLCCDWIVERNQIVQVVPRGQPKKFTCKLEVGIAIWQHKQGHDFI